MLEMELGDGQFERIARHIEEQYGISVPPEKRVMIQSRLVKRVFDLHFKTMNEYVEYILSQGVAEDEINKMITSISTHLTSFFREPGHFSYLSQTILPTLQRQVPTDRKMPFVVWSAACSSGEEVYSLAMVLEEFRVARISKGESFEYAVIGTDLAPGVLDTARAGIYPQTVLDAVPRNLKDRYLMVSRKRDGLVRVVPELRSRCFFRQLNLMEQPYTLTKKVQVIFCRNVLIYFNRGRQERVLTALCEHLLPGGYLVVGHAESLVHLDLPLSQEAPTLYRKVHHG